MVPSWGKTNAGCPSPRPRPSENQKMPERLNARLKLTEARPGTIHFGSDRDADYFRQLTAEKVVSRYERGRPVRMWQPKREGERNEALDTMVYANAALQGLITMGLRLNFEAAAMLAAPEKTGDSKPVPRQTARRRIIGSDYMQP